MESCKVALTIVVSKCGINCDTNSICSSLSPPRNLLSKLFSSQDQINEVTKYFGCIDILTTYLKIV